LEAFVERVNREGDETANSSEEAVEQPAKAESKTRPANRRLAEEDQHEIKLALRWKVIMRDHCRCVKCGASPATVLGCHLHVDHILPFSKGGKTVLENLQTLCENCNLGKGNRVECSEGD
jgi:5-methylcytosine-specific restriction endonuclease McrA